MLRLGGGTVKSSSFCSCPYRTSQLFWDSPGFACLTQIFTGTPVPSDSGAQQTCLSSPSSSASPAPAPVPNPTGVRVICQDLNKVFSKTKASSLPPHCPHNCATDLLPCKSIAIPLALPPTERRWTNTSKTPWRGGSSFPPPHLPSLWKRKARPYPQFYGRKI